MRFSLNQYRFMRVIASGSIPMSQWRTFDQRSVRALYLRGMFRFTKGLNAEISQDGWGAVSGMRRQPDRRQNPNRPTFVEANDGLKKTAVEGIQLVRRQHA